MKRTVQMKHGNVPRTRAEGPKKKLNPKRPQDQGRKAR